MNKKINELFFLYVSVCFWYIYFIYTIVLTFYNFNHLKQLQWEEAQNQTEVYSSLRSTTVTYAYEKEGVRISREYPGLFEGINTWLWNIDKKKNKENISFYIRDKDYIKIKNKTIKYRKDIFGNNLKEKESVPFFGLRKINSKSNKIMLFCDIWKYNYIWIVFIIVVIIPYALVYLLEKSKLFFFIKNEKNEKKDWYWNLAFIFLLIITAFNLII